MISSGSAHVHDRLSRGLLLCDRDGVIIQDRPGFVRSESDVAFVPGSIDALARAGEQGFPVVIVSNQSGIGRGLVSADKAVALHQDVVAMLEAAGARILASYICPHTPDDRCACRKPSPRMLTAAIAQYGVSRERSAFVGDAREDVTAAVRAGVLPVLVGTGRGRKDGPLVLRDPALAGVRRAPDLECAVGQLLRWLAPNPCEDLDVPAATWE